MLVPIVFRIYAKIYNDQVPNLRKVRLNTEGRNFNESIRVCENKQEVAEHRKADSQYKKGESGRTHCEGSFYRNETSGKKRT